MVQIKKTLYQTLAEPILPPPAVVVSSEQPMVVSGGHTIYQAKAEPVFVPEDEEAEDPDIAIQMMWKSPDVQMPISPPSVIHAQAPSFFMPDIETFKPALEMAWKTAQTELPLVARQPIQLHNRGPPLPDSLLRPFELAWEPSYPSQFLIPQAPVNEGAFSWHPDTPTPVADVQVEWIPSYPNVTRPIPPTPEGLFVLGQEPSLIVPFEQAWEPTYPTILNRAVQVREGYFVTAPVVPLPEVGWLPATPDLLRLPVRAEQGFFTLGQEPSLIVPFSQAWEPAYPSILLPARSPVDEGTFSWHTETPADVPEVLIQWLPNEPVVVRRKPQAPEGFYVSSPVEGFPPEVFFPGGADVVFAGPVTLYQAKAEPISVPALPDIGWLPAQPDVVLPVPLVAEGIFTLGLPEEFIRDFEISWAPTYPVVHLRAKAPVDEGLFAWNPETPVDFGVSWIGSWPDELRPARTPVNDEGFVLGLPPELVRPFGLSWLPSLPDVVRRGPPINEGSLVAPFVVSLPDIGWLPNPADVLRPAPSTREGLFVIGQPDELVRDFGLAWLPGVPDVVRPPSRVNGGSITSPFVIPLPDIGWIPNQADVTRRRRAASEGLFVIGQHEPLFDESLFRWQGEWPDQLLPPKRIITDYFTKDHIGAFLPEIGWIPAQPDVMRPRHQTRPGMFVIGQPEELLTIKHLGWKGTWPDQLLSALQPIREGFVPDPTTPDVAVTAQFFSTVSGMAFRDPVLLYQSKAEPFVVELPDIDWLVEPADVMRPIPPTEEGWFALGQPDSLIRDFNLAWRSSWPDQLLRPLRVITEGFRGDLEPILLPDIAWITPPADVVRRKEQARVGYFAPDLNPTELPDIAWIPAAPDVMRLVPQTQGYFTLAEEPTLVRAFGMAWSPTYPGLLLPAKRPVDVGFITKDLEIVVAPDIPFFQVPGPVLVRPPLVEYQPATELVVPPEEIFVDKWAIQYHNPMPALPQPVNQGFFALVDVTSLVGTRKAITIYAESGVVNLEGEAGTLVIYSEAGTLTLEGE